MGWRSIKGERSVVTRAVRAGDQAIAGRQWASGIRHYLKANRHAVTVAAAGESDQDQAVLGSIYYNLAELHVMAGDVSMAWLCALQACQVYQALDPSGGVPGRVESCLRSAGPAVRKVEERIGQTADARSRYVLLSAGLVREFGPRALRIDVGGGALDGLTDPTEVVDRIGESAIQTYRELLRHGVRSTHDDVVRTEHRITQARAIIAA
ncbi:hypothetical protein [Microlunatus speluncae]|uniref:hypothetical protein n=1 Tax=Microlunatus speluncae TaxID=2594267 RepID=UPI0012667214|nr:hypothetical protein [Microlunatus speluncae]